MKKGYIAVMDSGIGGLTVLKRLYESLPNENFVYVGDNDNVPYGEKSDRELTTCAIRILTEIISTFPVKCIVIGCNTLSMTILSKLKLIVEVPLFGVFPPVVLDDSDKTLLISTKRTAEEYKKYNFPIQIAAVKDLATEIEKNVFNLSEIDLKKFLPYKKGLFDTVILGCTHYDFIKNKINDHLKPQKILCGQDYTVDLVKKYCKDNKSLDFNLLNRIFFYGRFAKKNKLVWEKVVNYRLFFDKKQL